MKNSKKVVNKSTVRPWLWGLLLVAIIAMVVVYAYQLKPAYRGNSLLTVTKGNCLADDCLMVENLEYPVSDLPETVKSALNEAITDEYKALTVYQKVTSKFGMVRPFSMITSAEEQHIASLKALFDKYGLKVPQNNWSNKVTAPTTLVEACQTGVDAEIANAGMYKDKLLPVVKDYPDITLVFENLMNASQLKHLPAFERCN